jgi:hypothetical protein
MTESQQYAATMCRQHLHSATISGGVNPQDQTCYLATLYLDEKRGLVGAGRAGAVGSGWLSAPPATALAAALMLLADSSDITRGTLPEGGRIRLLVGLLLPEAPPSAGDSVLGARRSSGAP